MSTVGAALRRIGLSPLGPILLAVLAAVLWASTLWPAPYPATISGVVSLAKDAPQTLLFRTGPAGGYDAFIQFDHAAAVRAFPCQADPIGGGDACGSEAFPLTVSVAVEGPSGVIGTKTYDGAAERGGSYTSDTFGVRLAGWMLEGDTDYRLIVTSLVDGQPLSAAKPRLTVDLGPFEREAEVFGRLFPRLYAIAALAAGIVWGAIALLLGWRRAKRSQADDSKVAA